jgi:hypothetical protein
MSTVLFKRGSNAQMADTSIQDGLLYFNTEDHKIYMDNGSERLQYGGDTDLISNPSSASVTNVFSATASLNIFPQKETVVDDMSNALAVTQNYIPLGCLAFKEAVGNTDFSAVGDGTISGGLVALRGETLIGTLAAGHTTLTLNSEILTANSYIDVYTDNWEVAPSDVTTNDISKTITLTFDSQNNSVQVKVVVKNM